MGNDVQQYRCSIGTFASQLSHGQTKLCRYLRFSSPQTTPQFRYSIRLFNLVPITTLILLLFYMLTVLLSCSTILLTANNGTSRPNVLNSNCQHSIFLNNNNISFHRQPDLSSLQSLPLPLLLHKNYAKFHQIWPSYYSHKWFKFNVYTGVESLTATLHSHCYKFKLLSIIIIIAIIELFLVLSGDIEVNPGPDLDNDNFKALYVNIRSLTSNSLKLPELQHIAFVENPALIAIGETWLGPSILEKDLVIDNYTFVGRKDISRHEGGIMVYARNDIGFVRREELECDDIESIWLSVLHGNNKKSLFGFYYRTPSMDRKKLDSWLTNFESTVLKAIGMNPHTLNIMGDLNAKNKIWYPLGENNIAGILLYELLTNLGLIQLIQEPTRFENGSESCIDLVITDSPTLVMNTHVLPQIFKCDHCPITMDLKFVLPAGRPYTRTFYDYDSIDMNAIRAVFSAAPFLQLFETFSDVNELYEAFFDLFNSLVETTFPTKTLKIDPKSKPWFTTELSHMRRTMLRLNKKRKRTKKDDDYSVYSSAREAYHNKILEVVEIYNNKITEKIINSNPGDKMFWRLTRRILNKPPPNTIPPLYSNGEVVSSPAEKAEVLNNFFCSQSSIDESMLNIPLLPPYNGKIFSFEPITEDEVMKLLDSLDATKSSGPDGIPAKVLTICKDFIAPFLTQFYNKCLTEGAFPEALKKANIVPIFKKTIAKTPLTIGP